MKSIQQMFAGKGKHIDIPPGEYEGPLIIQHACTVDGHDATLWTKAEPALVIEASGVVVKNLRVEITESPETSIAVKLQKQKIQLEHVEVYGQIQEQDGKVSQWELPRMMDFGCFAAGKANEYCRAIKVGVPCRISSQVHGLSIWPQELLPGENKVIFKIAPLMDATILYGDFFLEAPQGIRKRIYIAGRAQKGASESHETQPPMQHGTKGALRVPQGGTAPSPSGTAPMAAPLPDFPGKTVVKGQRGPVPNAKRLFVTMQGDGSVHQVDPYAFQLYADGKTRQDSDLIFFGNPQSPTQGVYLDTLDGMEGIGISLEQIPQEIQRIVVTFSVYEEETGSSQSFSVNFSTMRNPRILLYADGKPDSMLPLNLGLEKALDALEFYRYKEGWKINFVGAGFTAGIKKLCETYGIEVA